MPFPTRATWRVIRPHARWLLAPVAAAVMIPGFGCAIHLTARDGSTHIFGLAHVRVTSADETANLRAVETSNIGLMLFATEANRGLSIGLNREAVVFPAATPPAPSAPDAAIGPAHPVSLNNE